MNHSSFRPGTSRTSWSRAWLGFIGTSRQNRTARLSKTVHCRQSLTASGSLNVGPVLGLPDKHPKKGMVMICHDGLFSRVCHITVHHNNSVIQSWSTCHITNGHDDHPIGDWCIYWIYWSLVDKISIDMIKWSVRIWQIVRLILPILRQSTMADWEMAYKWSLYNGEMMYKSGIFHCHVSGITESWRVTPSRCERFSKNLWFKKKKPAAEPHLWETSPSYPLCSSFFIIPYLRSSIHSGPQHWVDDFPVDVATNFCGVHLSWEN